MNSTINKNFNLHDSIINARTFRQRVLIVEKLLSITETLRVERLESLYNIPSDWLSNFLKSYCQHDISVSIYFSLPTEIVQSLTFNSDGRAIESHVKRVLKAVYESDMKLKQLS